MSNIIFPEGVTWTQRHMTGGDLLTSSDSVTVVGNLYRYAPNTIIKVGFDTSNITDMNNMFQYCTSVVKVTDFDTSNATSMSYMFNGCSVLKSVPNLDTSKVTNMTNMFEGCSQLKALPLFDCGNITSGYINIFGSSSSTGDITDLGGFKDLGKVSSFSKPTYFLKYCSKLTKESVLNVLNNLYDRAAAGYSVVTLPFHANALALLSDEEKAIATNKGWTLATS